jgi:hypothetical protein
LPGHAFSFDAIFIAIKEISGLSCGKTKAKGNFAQKDRDFYHFLAKLHWTKGTTIGVLIPDTD